jgi:RNA polymerase sigma-70 factor (ECF subfamily)
MLAFYTSVLEEKEEKTILAELYEQFKYDCLHIAMGILKNPESAEDAVQDAFVAVMTHKENYLRLPRGDFRNTILTIVKNRCIDEFRRKKYTADHLTDDWENDIEDVGLSVEDTVIRGMDIQYLRSYIKRISEVSRRVLEMKYFEGMSYREIGARLNISEKNASVRLARARQTVRDLMREDEQGCSRI